MYSVERLKKLASGEIGGEIPAIEYSLAADEIERLRVEVEVQAYWGPRWEQAYAEVLRLRSAIQQTLEENGHLADGDDCTLILLKRALTTPNAEVRGAAPTEGETKP